MRSEMKVVILNPKKLNFRTLRDLSANEFKRLDVRTDRYLRTTGGMVRKKEGYNYIVGIETDSSTFQANMPDLIGDVGRLRGISRSFIEQANQIMSNYTSLISQLGDKRKARLVKGIGLGIIVGVGVAFISLIPAIAVGAVIIAKVVIESRKVVNQLEKQNSRMYLVSKSIKIATEIASEDDNETLRAAARNFAMGVC